MDEQGQTSMELLLLIGGVVLVVVVVAMLVKGMINSQLAPEADDLVSDVAGQMGT
ncbi:MAG: class III signal peptide-containing protein [Candidatus Diapherotrites archaeon]